MVNDESSLKFATDILKIIHAPFGSHKSVQSKVAEDVSVASEVEGSVDLAGQFFNQTKEARYSVFQLVGRKVVKRGEAFEIDGGGYSHSWEKDPVRNFMNDQLNLEIMDLDHRMRELNRSKESVGENQVGVTSVYIDLAGGNTRLIIFGHFSLESRPMSSGASNRTNGHNSIYYVLSGRNASAVNDLLGLIRVDDKSREANIRNREVIVSTMSKVFPESVLKTIDSHMLRQLEVDKIIDRRG